MTGVGVGGLAGGAGTLPGFPPVTLAEMQRYQATFAAVDADRDGFVKVRMLRGAEEHAAPSMLSCTLGLASSASEQRWLCKGALRIAKERAAAMM
jgi:hypothetical protein